MAAWFVAESNVAVMVLPSLEKIALCRTGGLGGEFADRTRTAVEILRYCATLPPVRPSVRMKLSVTNPVPVVITKLLLSAVDWLVKLTLTGEVVIILAFINWPSEDRNAGVTVRLSDGALPNVYVNTY